MRKSKSTQRNVKSMTLNQLREELRTATGTRKGLIENEIARRARARAEVGKLVK